MSVEIAINISRHDKKITWIGFMKQNRIKS